MRVLPALCCLSGLLVMGCASTTIHFNEPPGTTLEVMGKTYTWPATVAFPRPDDVGAEQVHSLKMFIPGGNAKLSVKGEIHVYGYLVTDVDKYAVNDCAIDEAHLERLRSGHAVTIEGFSAGQRVKLYRMILGREE